MTDVRRRSNGTFATGARANPGGRPKTACYAAAARELLASKSLKAPEDWGSAEDQTNAQIASKADFDAWLAGDAQAASRLLDRAEGRPALAVELEGAIGFRRPPDGVSPEEVEAVSKNPDGFLAAHLASGILRAVYSSREEADPVTSLLLEDKQVRDATASPDRTGRAAEGAFISSDHRND